MNRIVMQYIGFAMMVIGMCIELWHLNVVPDPVATLGMVVMILGLLVVFATSGD